MNNIHDLLIKGIRAVQAGQKLQAKLYLTQALEAGATGREQTEAWYWLSQITPDAAEKQRYLQQILAADPQHERAQKALAPLQPQAADIAPPPAADSRQCPQCDTKLVFSGDGRHLLCERCDYRRPVAAAKRRESISELMATLKFASQASLGSPAETAAFADQGQTWLTLGLTAIKTNDYDEAYSYLSRLVASPYAQDTLKEEAWLGLSAICNDQAEKRLCLENVIALDPYDPRARKELAILDGRLSADQIIDPDRLKPQVATEQPQVAQAQRMVCPNCGNRMHFTPDHSALLCDACGHSHDAPAQEISEIEEQDFISAMFTERGHRRPVDTRSIQCPGCGVSFTLAPETLSVTCAYCSSVFVTDAAETQSVIPPDAIIPFAFAADQAEQLVRNWLHKHKLKHALIVKLTGLYLPAWTFDVMGILNWSCQISDNASGNRQWKKHYDTTTLLIDDHLVPAKEQLPPVVHRHLQEFQSQVALPYDAKFLADWPAERYQLKLSDMSIRARTGIMKQLQEKARRKMQELRGNQFRQEPDSRIEVQSYKSILLPVWLGTYKVKDERYQVMVNGQSSAVHGDRPQGFLGKILGI